VGGSVKRSLAMVAPDIRKVIAKAFGPFDCAQGKLLPLKI